MQASRWNSAGGTRRQARRHPPVCKEDAALEEGVGGAPRQPLYPLHQGRVDVLAAKLRGRAGSRGREQGGSRQRTEDSVSGGWGDVLAAKLRGRPAEAARRRRHSAIPGWTRLHDGHL
jgi:hypothetical protein